MARLLIVPVLGSMALMLTPGLYAQAGGEAIFKKQCGMCHGPDGSGNTGMGKTFKLRDLRSAEVQKQTDTQLTDIIAKGKGKMPAYEANLGHDGVQSVVVYIRQLGKAKK